MRHQAAERYRGFFHMSLITTADVSTLGICVSSQSPGEVKNKPEQHQYAAEYVRGMPSA